MRLLFVFPFPRLFSSLLPAALVFEVVVVVQKLPLPASRNETTTTIAVLDVVHEQREERAEDEYDRESDAKVQDLFLLSLRVFLRFNSFECADPDDSLSDGSALLLFVRVRNIVSLRHIYTHTRERARARESTHTQRESFIDRRKNKEDPIHRRRRRRRVVVVVFSRDDDDVFFRSRRWWWCCSSTTTTFLLLFLLEDEERFGVRDSSNGVRLSSTRRRRTSKRRRRLMKVRPVKADSKKNNFNEEEESSSSDDDGNTIGLLSIQQFIIENVVSSPLFYVTFGVAGGVYLVQKFGSNASLLFSALPVVLLTYISKSEFGEDVRRGGEESERGMDEGGTEGGERREGEDASVGESKVSNVFRRGKRTMDAAKVCFFLLGRRL